MSRPRVLFMTLEYPPMIGGVGRMYAALINAAPTSFRLWRHRGKSPLQPYEFDAPLLSRWGWPRWMVTVVSLARAFRAHGVSPVIVGQVLPLGIAAWICSFVWTFRYAVILHGMDAAQPLRHWRKRWMVNHILRRAWVVVGANANVLDVLRKTAELPPGRTMVLYPTPVITPQAAAARQRSSGVPVILSVGRLVPRKGFDVLLQAMAYVWTSVPEAQLVIAGDGPERHPLEALANHLGAGGRVTFAGSVDDARLAELYASASVFAMLPRALPGGDIEGVGIVFLEAAAFGVPVVATRSGAIPEVVCDHETGILVPENDATEAAAAIATLLQDDDLRDRLGAEASRRAAGMDPADHAHRLLQTLYD